MNDVTKILDQIERGDDQAAEKLLPILYQELRKLAQAKLAQEKSGQSIQATDLVHEAYLRLIGSPSSENQWNGRHHFFGAAAEAMRRILVDRARAKKAIKRGGDYHRIEFEQLDHPAARKADELLSLNEALQKLESEDAAKANLVKLRFFAGMTSRQAADLLKISKTTADRHWAYSRAWLKAEMSRE